MDRSDGDSTQDVAPGQDERAGQDGEALPPGEVEQHGDSGDGITRGDLLKTAAAVAPGILLGSRAAAAAGQRHVHIPFARRPPGRSRV